MIGYGRLPRPPRSLPGLTRQSIYFARLFRSMMDAGVTPGHDEWGRGGSMVSSSQHAHDVALLHDQEFFAVELDLGARPFAEQHAVADLEVDRDQFAGLVAAARADRGDLTLRGLFLGGVRNDNAALGLLFGVDTLDHDAVMQRAKFGFGHDGSLCKLVFRSGSGPMCDRMWMGIRAHSTPPRRQNSSYP